LAKKEGNKSGKRYFKMIHEQNLHKGKYIGRKPKQAASKALTSIWRNEMKNGNDVTGKTLNIVIKEFTRNKTHKIHEYEGTRIKLDKPTEVKLKLPDDTNGNSNVKTILYKYTNKLHKIKPISKTTDDETQETATVDKTKKSTKKSVKSAKSAEPSVEHTEKKQESKSKKGGSKKQVAAATVQPTIEQTATVQSTVEQTATVQPTVEQTATAQPAAKQPAAKKSKQRNAVVASS
jgi:hypothetical protein